MCLTEHMPNASTVQSDTDEGPVLVHITQAGVVLGLSRYQVRGLINEGLLTAVKVGARTYIPAAALSRYIEDVAS